MTSTVKGKTNPFKEMGLAVMFGVGAAIFFLASHCLLWLIQRPFHMSEFCRLDFPIYFHKAVEWSFIWASGGICGFYMGRWWKEYSSSDS